MLGAGSAVGEEVAAGLLDAAVLLLRVGAAVLVPRVAVALLVLRVAAGVLEPALRVPPEVAAVLAL